MSRKKWIRLPSSKKTRDSSAINEENASKEQQEENKDEQDKAEETASIKESAAAAPKKKPKNEPSPKRIAWRRRLKKARKVLCILLVFFAAAAVGLHYYIEKENETLEVTFYHLQSDEVEAAFRIVQLSDLHLHEFGEKNAELVDWIKRLNPDIIAITGDMNNRFNDDTHVVTELCTQLTDITDVYYVMGNHEWVDYIHRKTNIKKDLVATGVVMLENSYIETEINGNKVVIGGLVNEVSNYEKYTGPQFMEKFMKADGFKLLLVHYPEYFLGTLNQFRVDLAMCGHTHGGLIRIPHFGGLYASDQGFLPELYEGMQTVKGGSVVVVSRGLGNNSKIPRINNNPEIVVVDVNWY
ncbi:MAG: metallophosphoesterase [Clostridia bacterium]|nr:metallophosphoesterase [Clostridia bacterium]MBR6186206.1 metallophosphoesterase [Clostridia bacterium]